MKIVRYLITVEGRVQGVGFRYFALCHAQRLGLSGWIQNREDGSVLLTVQGEEGAASRFLGIIRQGNYAIRVDSLSVRDLPVLERQDGFQIL